MIIIADCIIIDIQILIKNNKIYLKYIWDNLIKIK